MCLIQHTTQFNDIFGELYSYRFVFDEVIIKNNTIIYPCRDKLEIDFYASQKCYYHKFTFSAFNWQLPSIKKFDINKFTELMYKNTQLLNVNKSVVPNILYKRHDFRLESIAIYL